MSGNLCSLQKMSSLIGWVKSATMTMLHQRLPSGRSVKKKMVLYYICCPVSSDLAPKPASFSSCRFDFELRANKAIAKMFSVSPSNFTQSLTNWLRNIYCSLVTSGYNWWIQQSWVSAWLTSDSFTQDCQQPPANSDNQSGNTYFSSAV